VFADFADMDVLMMIEQSTHLIQREREEKERLRIEVRELAQECRELKRQLDHVTRRYLDLRKEVQADE
jgi:hypothetical protein